MSKQRWTEDRSRLEQAIRCRGIPKRLYVDNGAAFRAQHLALVCAKLGITLIHARPYQPQGKGKMERWFRTARLQLLPTLQPEDKTSLEALNRRLWAWVEGEYHRSPHRGLDGDTPADPARPREQRSLQVWHRGARIQLARRVDVYANCFVRRDHTTKTLHPTAAEPSEAAPPSAAAVPKTTRTVFSDVPQTGYVYEQRTYPIEALGPLDAIKTLCEYLGWSRRDLEQLIGSRRGFPKCCPAGAH